MRNEARVDRRHVAVRFRVATVAGLFTDAIRQDPFARWLEDSGQIFGVPMRRTSSSGDGARGLLEE